MKHPHQAAASMLGKYHLCEQKKIFFKFQPFHNSEVIVLDTASPLKNAHFFMHNPFCSPDSTLSMIRTMVRTARETAQGRHMWTEGLDM